MYSGPTIGQRIEQFKEICGFSKNVVNDEYVFVNIAYDKQLVHIYDEFGLPKGNIDITDRKKLSLFLNKLCNNHRYVLMDVLFSDEYRSQNDTSLITAILNTERISISRSSTIDLIDDRLNEKAGYTDYSTDILETNFVKYEFIKDGEATMPYMAFQSLEPNKPIYSFGPIYWCNWHFCWNSLILRFPIKLWNSHVYNDGVNQSVFHEKKVLNLGADILDMDVDVPSLVKDKIVVIGDFTENDIHDTYLGKMAGPIINVNALESLRNNELEIPWMLIFFLVFLHTIVTYILLRKPISIDKLLNKLHLNNSLVKYLLSFVGYSFIFAIIGGGIYLLYGIDINVLVPTLWFTFLSVLINIFSL